MATRGGGSGGGGHCAATFGASGVGASPGSARQLFGADEALDAHNRWSDAPSPSAAAGHGGRLSYLTLSTTKPSAAARATVSPLLSKAKSPQASSRLSWRPSAAASTLGFRQATK